MYQIRRNEAPKDSSKALRVDKGAVKAISENDKEVVKKLVGSLENLNLKKLEVDDPLLPHTVA